MSFQLEVHESEAAWARAIAALWQQRLAVKPKARLCLPAGLTPVRVYAEMIRAVQEGRARFAEAEVFLLDEYGGLAPDDPGRCASMLRRFLLDRVDLPPTQFHVPDVDAEDLDAACLAYDRAVGRELDLVLLGIGRNGHVGMNEPGTPVDVGTHCATLQGDTVAASARYLAHDRFPTWGLTLGLRPLLAAREVWLLACGAAKAPIVAAIRDSEPHAALPASWFQGHPNCRFFVDRAAFPEG